jgi:hypothetical protein
MIDTWVIKGAGVCDDAYSPMRRRWPSIRMWLTASVMFKTQTMPYELRFATKQNTL